MALFRTCSFGLAFFMALSTAARAEFLVSPAIIEFTAEGPQQQDIELVSHSKDNDYIVTDISEVLHPGTAEETRREIHDPGTSALLVTPDKSILAGGSRRILRFVLLKAPDAQEHIYRVAVKPVIKDIAKTTQVGLKILVGYEVLVIIRPTTIVPAYHIERHGKTLTVQNQGNSHGPVAPSRQQQEHAYAIADFARPQHAAHEW